jgi:fructokinase
MQRPTNSTSGPARESRPHPVPEPPLPSPFRPLIFGETLFDHFPDGTRALGGAPFNVAWHLRGFKAAPLLITRIGEDPEGREIQARMGEWEMDTRGVQLHPDRPSGKVTVSLHGGDARFRIEPGQAWDDLDIDHLPPPETLAEADLLYHGTLAMRETRTREALAHLRDTGAAPVLVDVNLREPWWTPESVAWALDGAQWAKMNVHEAGTLGGMPTLGDAAPADGAVATAAETIRSRHGIRHIIVTMGSRGALGLHPGGLVRQDGKEMDGLVDTVGAGDAFSAVVALGIHGSWPMDTILRRAAEFAAHVCRVRGATSRDPELYARHRRSWDHDE